MKKLRSVFLRSLPGRSPLCPSLIGIPETKEVIIHHPDHNDFILCQSIVRRHAYEGEKPLRRHAFARGLLPALTCGPGQYWTRVQSTYATSRHTLTGSRVSIVVCQPHGLARGDIPLLPVPSRLARWRPGIRSVQLTHLFSPGAERDTSWAARKLPRSVTAARRRRQESGSARVHPKMLPGHLNPVAAQSQIDPR